MTTLTNPKNGAQVTVPDNVADSYVSRGWVRPGTPAPAEPANPLDIMTVAELREHAEEHGIDLAGARIKDDIRAVIKAAAEPENIAA